MRLLLTGFEPFGNETQNPSARIIEALKSERVRGVSWQRMTLPVRRCDAFDALCRAWDGERFDVWLGLGQAGGRARVCAERCAQNLYRPAGVRGEPSASGDGERLIADAAYLQVCRWPAAELVDALAHADLPIALSDCAGTYVCNELLFRMEHRLCSRPQAPSCEAWAAFLHLPYLPEQLAGKPPDTPALSLETQLQVVLRSIAWLRDARAAAHNDESHRAQQGGRLADPY